MKQDGQLSLSKHALFEEIALTRNFEGFCYLCIDGGTSVEDETIARSIVNSLFLNA